MQVIFILCYADAVYTVMKIDAFVLLAGSLYMSVNMGMNESM